MSLVTANEDNVIITYASLYGRSPLCIVPRTRVKKRRLSIFMIPTGYLHVNIAIYSAVNNTNVRLYILLLAPLKKNKRIEKKNKSISGCAILILTKVNTALLINSKRNASLICHVSNMQTKIIYRSLGL